MRNVLLIGLIVLLTGCSLPRLVVLNDPLDAREHNDLGIAYEQRGELELAEREYRKAAELDENWARPWVNLGNVRAAADNWSEATEAYRKALQRDAQLHEAMNNLAWALLQQQEPEQALPWAEQAVAAAPELPAYLDTLAATELALGRFPQALSAVERALELNPEPSLRQELEARRTLLQTRQP